MANDELQTRIAEQKKLVEDKKKLLQNLKNLEQVEKEVRVEIDKILPEKTKFEEWAKYFGNDGKSDQVLNWFGDELKKLKAKLDRVQGMRTKIKAVQDKIDSQLVRLNQEIENFKKLPKPVVRHQPEEKVAVITSQTPAVVAAKIPETKPVSLSSKMETQKPPVLHRSETPAVVAAKIPETKPVSLSSKTETQKPPVLPRPDAKEIRPDNVAPASKTPEKDPKMAAKSAETNRAKTGPIAPDAVISPKEPDRTALKAVSKLPATPPKSASTPVEKKVVVSSPESEQAEKIDKPLQKVVEPKENTSKPPTGKDAGFSPAHKNLLQDIAKKAKLTTEKIEAEKQEETETEKRPAAKSEGSKALSEKKESLSGSGAELPEKPTIKISAKPATAEMSEVKNKPVATRKAESPSVLPPTKTDVRTSEKTVSPEKMEEPPPEPNFTHKLKEQKYKYINGQPVREKVPIETRANTVAEQKAESKPEVNKNTQAPEGEKRAGVFSSIKGKLFEKNRSKTHDKKNAVETETQPKTEFTESVKNERTDSTRESSAEFSERTVPKAEQNIEARSIFDDSVSVLKTGLTSEKSETTKSRWVEKPEMAPKSVEPEKPQSKKQLESSQTTKSGSVANAPTTKNLPAEKRKEEVIVPAKSLLDDAVVETGKPVGDAVPPSVTQKSSKIPVKSAEETAPREIIVETESLLHTTPEKSAATSEGANQKEAKPEAKAKTEQPIPGLKPPEKPAKTELSKPEPTVPIVDSDSRQGGDKVRVLAPFRSKEDVLYLGIDLGTYETTIAASNGVIATTVSAVGWPKDMISRNLLKKDILFGEEALKHKLALRFYRPLAEGVIKNSDEDLEAATELIKHVLTLIRPEKFKKVYAVIGAPAQANLHNEQAIFDAAREVIDAVTIVSEPFAVAYGEANIYNTLVIDIGAGTTDLCRLRGTMPDEEDQITLLKAGDYIDKHLVEALEQRVKGVQVTKDMARRWKETYSFVMSAPKPVLVDVSVEGKPLRVDISSCIQKSCEMIVADIADSARKLISTFDPEFQPELKQNIILAGGGSLIHNLDVYLTQKLNMLGKVNIKKVPNPIEAGARGALALAMDVTDDFWRGLS